MTHVRIAALCAIALASILGSGACGTRANPDFCCTDTASCIATGTDVGVTRCDQDPARPYCDDDGDFGTPRTCIADPSSSDCASPADCVESPDRPFCVDRRCVQCIDGDDCANPTPTCAPSHLCTPCMDAPDCAGDPAGPACVNGSCAECGEAADCMSADRPFCDETSHVCRGCRADGECGNEGVCDRDAGTCTPASEILHARPGGVGTACDMASPCSLTRALEVAAMAGNRRTIRLAAGRYTEGGVIQGGIAVVLHGAGAGLDASRDTILDPPDNMHGLAIGGGAPVTVEDLAITGTSGTVTMPVTFNGPANGIRCAGGDLTLRRVLVDSNPSGGLNLSGCPFTIRSTIVSRNGGPSSFFGGVSLSQIGDGTGWRSIFEFNTVANNFASPGNIAGVVCSQITPVINLDNSIFYGNDVVGQPEVGGNPNCVPTNSIVGDVTPGPGNQNLDPLFVSSSDFHLQVTSPAEGDASNTATHGYDIDGDPRPLGTDREPGADEIVPP